MATDAVAHGPPEFEGQPLFSVVTVTKDDLNGLKRTWRSLAAQDFHDWEWIVVDGASGDGTRQWLESLEPGPDWSSEPDRGIFDAMNKGLDRARGRYVLFLNGGDELAGPDVLSRAEAVLGVLEPEPVLAYGDAVNVDRAGREFPSPAKSPGFAPWGMIGRHQAMFFSLAGMGGMRYSEEYNLAADYALVCVLVRDHGASDGILRLDLTVARFHLGGTGTVRRMQGLAECFRIRRRVLSRSWAFAALAYVLELGLHGLKKWGPGLAFGHVSSRRV